MKKMAKNSKLFVCLIMVMLMMVSFCFCGCSMSKDGSLDDIGEGAGKESNIDAFGYKIAFRPTLGGGSDGTDYYKVDKQYDKVATYLLCSLSAYYGAGHIYDYTPGISGEVVGDSVGEVLLAVDGDKATSYADAIRYSVKISTTIDSSSGQNVAVYSFGDFDEDNAWNWSFGYEYTINRVISLKSLIEDFSSSDYKDNYENLINKLQGYYSTDYAAAYVEAYQSFYSGFLELTLLDICLGNEVKSYLADYTVDYNDADGMPMVMINGNRYPLIDNTQQSIFLNNYTYTANGATLSSSNNPLYKLSQDKREEFNKYSNYIGFTRGDCEKVIEFVLDEVIGVKSTDASYAQYESYVRDTCENMLLSTQVDTAQNTDESGSASDLNSSAIESYSRVAWVDVDSTAFVEDVNNGLDDIDAHEYSSMIMMNENPDYIWGYMLYFEAQRDMSIYCYTRHYDYETGTLTEAIDDGVMVNVIGGKFALDDELSTIGGANEWVELPEEIYLDEFDNNDRIATEDNKYVSYNNKAYVTQETDYGTATVLDTSYATSSFFEVVFVIQKDSEDEVSDYSFKFAIADITFDWDR